MIPSGPIGWQICLLHKVRGGCLKMWRFLRYLLGKA
jgi:hypothetical protein